VTAIDWTTVNCVLFDLDETLVHYRRSPGELLQESFDALDLHPLFPVEEYYARFDEFRQQHDTIQQLRSACFATLAADHGHDPSLGRRVADAYTERRDQTNVELSAGARRVLDRLHGEYRLGIVTNGTGQAQRAKIDSVNLERWVDATVFAGEDVPPKPDTEPFERALSALDAVPGETVHVGDSLASDIAGANAAGLYSVWLADGTDPGAHQPTRRIDSIDDLLASIGE
jgi:HAD superfamily hydrolase (TIGR01549 family)